jgi:hypothetical protein
VGSNKHVVASALLLFACAPAAAAQDTARLALDVSGCASADGAAIERLVGIELRVAVVGTAAGVTSVRAECADSVLRLVVHDPITAKTVERSYDLSTTDARALSRTIALAIAELVTATWSELELEPDAEPLAEPQVTPEPLGATRDEAARASARRVVEATRPAPPRRWTIAAFGLIRFGLRDPALGAGARVAFGPVAWLELEIAATASRAWIDTGLGTLRADALDLAALAFARWPLRPFALRFGLGVRGGGAWIAGEPSNPAAVEGTSVGGTHGAAIAEVGAGYEALDVLIVSLAVQGGIVFHGIEARTEDGDRQSIARGDLQLGVTVGAGIRL